MSQEPPPPTGEIILYSTEDGRARVECRFAGETVWLTQALMAELFDISVPTVNEHLHNIFEEAELDPETTIRKFRIVRREGTREVARLIDHYNLEAILAAVYPGLPAPVQADSHDLLVAPFRPPAEHFRP